MVPVSYYRTSNSDINNVPVVDGQLVVGTENSEAKMYVDIQNNRLPVLGLKCSYDSTTETLTFN
jgi:hypothetical protein